MSSNGASSSMQWRRRPIAGPHGLAWWIAWLFMIGSSLFALGSFPIYSQNVDPGAVGITFVVGSIFFTSAALGQFVQEIGDPDDRNRGGASRWWRPSDRAWLAVAIQLVGTILFNINTVDAMIEGLTREETNRLVWAPDMFGSVAFLVASHLAWIGVCGRLWCVRTGDAEWWSSGANYVGSIFFMVSAIASVVLPTTGETLNISLVNSATCAGALCFLGGAYLLLPPNRSERSARSSDVGDAGRHEFS